MNVLTGPNAREQRRWGRRALPTAATCGLMAALAWLLESATGPSTVSFEDISARAGVSAALRNGSTPEKHQIETMAGGIALFDYDGDGLLDIFIANGAQQPGLVKPDPTWWNRRYRNSR